MCCTITRFHFGGLCDDQCKLMLRISHGMWWCQAGHCLILRAFVTFYLFILGMYPISLQIRLRLSFLWTTILLHILSVNEFTQGKCLSPIFHFLMRF